MKSDLPLVSICVPTYNCAGTVRETLESILAQSYVNIRVHISDNASTDETMSVIESVRDARMIVHRHDENIGGEGNFNRCINYAEGDYTAIYHADDIYEPQMVAEQVAFLEANASAAAVFTEATLIDEKGRKTGRIRFPGELNAGGDLYDFQTVLKAVLKHSNFLICPSVMARTRVYKEEIGCWRGGLFKSSADLDLWLRMLEKHNVGFLRCPLMSYRISSTQWSARVRKGTERADFFLVTEHYLARESVRALLSPTDLKNYRWLERRDRVMQALNLFLIEENQRVKPLLSDLVSLDAVEAGLKTKRGFFVLVVGLYMKMVLALGCARMGKMPLRMLKQVTGK